jgi:hypothetical protein
MRRLIPVAVASLGVSVLATVGLAGPAGATPPTGYGFDNTAHIIVGGGSDTTWNAQLLLQYLWEGAPSCLANTTVGPSMSDCVTTNPNPETNTLGNYQRDTMAQAYPVGSTAGIASLNGFGTGTAYAGTTRGSSRTVVDAVTNGTTTVTSATAAFSANDVNLPVLGTNMPPGDTIQSVTNATTAVLSLAATGSTTGGALTVVVPSVDFARSSRPARTGTNGQCGTGGSELICDTFWGYSQDGIEVGGFNVAGTGQGTLLHAATPRITVTDGTTTLGSPNISAPDAAFTASDVGKAITGTNIPYFPTGTTIASVTDATDAVMSQNATATAAGTATFVIGTQFSAADMYHIWNCDWTTWGAVNDLKGLGLNAGAPIVPFGMNPSSGTEATFQGFLQTAGGNTSFNINAGACVRPLTGTGPGVTLATYPFENDIKPIVNQVFASRSVADGVENSTTTITSATANFTAADVNQTITAGDGSLPADTVITSVTNATTVVISHAATATNTGLALTIGGIAPATDTNSINNPNNWLWWGSFGILSTFPFTSSFTVGGLNNAIVAAPVNGVLPSGSFVLANTYPFGRTLFHVTLKADADCPKSAGVCNFLQTVNPGPGIGTGAVACSNGTTGALCDLQVLGATGGVAGAVREYTRFLCRSGTTRQATDPLQGKNYSQEITSQINKAGFQLVPTALRSPGSNCAVTS